VHSPTQRRQFWIYALLPLGVVFVLLAVVKLLAVERAEMIAELTDRIAHRGSSEAAAAVRQLAAIPRPPVQILVAAATSADLEVAEEAKLSISKLLRQAQRQIQSEQRVGAVARQLADLAESLAAQKSVFSTADYSWLSSTTRKVLRLANQIQPRHAPLVAAHCDAVLAAIASNEALNREIVGTEPEDQESFIGEEAMIDSGRQSLQAGFQSGGSTALGQGNGADATKPVHASVPARDAPPAEISARELIEAPWRASWSHPVFRMVPARPIITPPGEDLPPAAAPMPEPPAKDSEAANSPLASIESRELLRRWVRAEGSTIYPLEQELTRRGFGRLSERLVQQLFSASPEDRLTLANSVLTEPGVDARPWLILLSEDSHADVRLAAVSIMATSNEAALVKQAWQVAIRDRDPRIAGLVERLRERQASTLQR
jgi:hypothetical protein